MVTLNPFATVLQGLASAVPEPVKHLQQELESSAKQMLEHTLYKMNLVTREEFDVQSAVLQRTRAKLEALEQQVAHLETRLNVPTAAQATETTPQQHQ